MIRHPASLQLCGAANKRRKIFLCENKVQCDFEQLHRPENGCPEKSASTRNISLAHTGKKAKERGISRGSAVIVTGLAENFRRLSGSSPSSGEDGILSFPR
jgi:hypothetical protein